jgi:hypothetical protein
MYIISSYHRIIVSLPLIAGFRDHIRMPVISIFNDKTLFCTKMKFDTFSIERIIYIWFSWRMIAFDDKSTIILVQQLHVINGLWLSINNQNHIHDTMMIWWYDDMMLWCYDAMMLWCYDYIGHIHSQFCLISSHFVSFHLVSLWHSYLHKLLQPVSLMKFLLISCMSARMNAVSFWSPRLLIISAIRNKS